MKAMVCTKYGSPEVLQLTAVEKPIPKDHEVLLKILATTVTSGDARMRSFNVPLLFWLPYRIFLGIRKPKNDILGTSFSGKIEAVGKAVKLFKVGDPIFGSSDAKQSCYAEYICLPEDGVLTLKPKNMSDEEAAALFFGGHTALHFLRKGKIQSGQKVLIYGASGCVGTYAVQLARYFGAEVTGVCSTTNLELVKSLGADKVIDYTTTDFTKSGAAYDIIFDTTGKSSFSGCIKSLKKKGVYLRTVHLTLSPILRGIWTSITSSKKVIGGVANEKREDLEFLKKLWEEGNLKAVIDKVYPFEQIPAAHEYLDTGRKKGSLVINVQH